MFVTSHAKVTMVKCYAPPNDHEEVQKDEYYQQLQDLISHISCHDINIVMGDMNTQIGCDRSDFEHVLGQHAYGKHMDNGNNFINFCAMNKLKISSSIFQHKDIHKIIWISNDHKTATQIDHLAIGPIWRTLCLQYIRVYHGTDICSHHRLMVAKIKIKLKRFKKGSQVIK